MATPALMAGRPCRALALYVYFLINCNEVCGVAFNSSLGTSSSSLLRRAKKSGYRKASQLLEQRSGRSADEMIQMLSAEVLATEGEQHSNYRLQAVNSTKRLASNTSRLEASRGNSTHGHASNNTRQAPPVAAAVPPVAPPPVVIYDTWGWTNGHGSTCPDYATNAWCAGGNFVAGAEWSGAKYTHHPSCTWGEDCAQFYNSPATNCVVCGKSVEVADTLWWTNGHGQDCAYYETNWYCHGGAFYPDFEWTGARGVHHASCTWGQDCSQFYNDPAANCKVCGKRTEVTDTPLWTSGHGQTCADYATNWYCHGGAFYPDYEWTGAKDSHHSSCTWGEDCRQFYNAPADNCVACGKRANVVDTPGWTNGHGQTCLDYDTNWYCHGGAFMPENKWTGARGTTHASCTWGEDCAQFYNYPGDNCVVCGKRTCADF